MASLREFKVWFFIIDDVSTAWLEFQAGHLFFKKYALNLWKVGFDSFVEFISHF